MFALILVAPRLARYPGARSASADPHAHMSMPAGMNMSDDAMRAMAIQYRATHPEHVSGPVRLASVLDAPADSFLASNFIFQEDGSAATQIDTAKIQVGQTIRFKWITGFHTVTSGTGSSDPNMGVLFNKPLQSAGQTFDLTFTDPATIPFFCTFHELNNMKGVIVVKAAADVPPARVADVGFVS